MSAPTAETYLKKRQDVEAKKRALKADKAAANPRNKPTKKYEFVRAERFVSDFRFNAKNDIRVKRRSKAAKKLQPVPSSDLVMVVRLVGISDASDSVRKICKVLRLTKVNYGVLVKVNEKSLDMLNRIGQYVTWGPIDRQNVSDLLYKRGYAKINGELIPLTNNAIIEKHLGDSGIICLEDIVHELVGSNENFIKANDFLAPFKLNVPVGGFAKKRVFNEHGGDSGYRGEEMMDLIKRMT